MMSDYLSFTLIIVLRKVDDRLYDLLEGVSNSTVKPSEIIILNMDASLKEVIYKDLIIQRVDFAQLNSDVISSGTSRNEAREYATNDRLLFMDFDCIPSENFFKEMLATYDEQGGVLLGHVSHTSLSNTTEQDSNDTSYTDQEIDLFHESEIQGNKIFSHVCFLISRENFDRIEGFDTNFSVPNIEVLDFVYRCKNENIPFYFSKAKVFCSSAFKTAEMGKLFHEILENCTKFYVKWGEWPMQKWLGIMDQLELIEWDENADFIKMKTEMDDHEVDEGEAGPTA